LSIRASDRSYPLNAWNMACFANDLTGEQMLARTLLHRPVIHVLDVDGLPFAPNITPEAELTARYFFRSSGSCSNKDVRRARMVGVLQNHIFIEDENPMFESGKAGWPHGISKEMRPTLFV
jgi:hypothetical protein